MCLWGPAACHSKANRPGWWKGKSAVFQRPAAVGGSEGGGRLSSPRWHAGLRALTEGAGGGCAEQRGHLLVGHRWPDQQHLDCLTARLQFLFIWGPLSELQPLTSWVPSGHLVVNFSTWGFGAYKTAHRIWPRMSSTALEEELKVLDAAWWLHYYCLVSFDCFPLFQHFSLFWLNVFFDWSFPQTKGRQRNMAGGWGAGTVWFCSVSTSHNYPFLWWEHLWSAVFQVCSSISHDGPHAVR